ncbi:peptidase E [Halobacillus fulvus]|nr:peptidase E [Halobacillus fulvus]
MKQIIALGGGGFSMEPDNPLLDGYILRQVKKERPSICFIPTASGDSDTYITRFYDFFEKQACHAGHLSLFKREGQRDIRSFLLEQDILYVGGGSTKNMLALWKEWEMIEVLKEAYENGIVLAGISAGAICWFQQGLTDSYGSQLEPLSCLGFLEGSCCPHYDGEEARVPMYRKYIKSRALSAGYALDDGAAVHFVDGKQQVAVSSRPDAKVYDVYEKDGSVVERPLPVHYLG